MTEYDYSPEAAERYQAKLHSIGRWVHETERFEPVNPFVLSPAAASTRLPGGSDGSTSRHRPHRSYTAPAKGSQSSSAQYSSHTYYQPPMPQNYSPQYPKYPYPYPVSPQASGPYPPPQRSRTFPAPPPPPPLPRPSHTPKRSNTSAGYGSPEMIYDPRVGTALRHVFTPYQTQGQSPSKRWFGKLFSGLRSASPSRTQSSSITESQSQSRHGRSKSGHHRRDYDRPDYDRHEYDRHDYDRHDSDRRDYDRHDYDRHDRHDYDRETSRNDSQRRSKSHSRAKPSKSRKSRSSSL